MFYIRKHLLLNNAISKKCTTEIILASNEDMIFVTEKIDIDMNIYMCSRYQWNLY